MAFIWVIPETATMPTVSYYLSEKHVLPPEDLKKLESKVKGQTLTLKLTDKDMTDGKISSTVNWKNEMVSWIKAFGLSSKGFTMLQAEGKVDGKISSPGDYEFYVTANRQRTKATLTVVAPKIVAKVEPKYSFANSKVKGLCDDMVIKKIISIAQAGKGETGHGPVEYLEGALHAHVTNTIGVAWKWKGDEVHVIAVGKKNNQNKEQQRAGKGKKLKTCEYDWTE